MLVKIYKFIFALAITGLILVHSATKISAQDSGAMAIRTITVGSAIRTYQLFVPSTYDENSPAPLVIAFHPAGGNGSSMAYLTGLNIEAERDGVIIAYPEGPQGYWDYGVGLPEWEPLQPLNQDLDFFEALLAELTTEFNVDETQLYAIGFSNGARMAFRVACEYGDRLAGIVAVSATISEDITNICDNENAVSIMFMHGTEDETTPWEGEELTEGPLLITYAWSAPNTATFWALHNQCDVQSPEIVDMPDPNPDDRESVRRVTFQDCAAESTVVFYAVLGGGHG